MMLSNQRKSFRPHLFNQLGRQVSYDVLYHLRYSISGNPSPIFPSLFIHKFLRPTVGNILPHLFWFIGYREFGKMFFDFLHELLGSEFHGLNVVARPDG